MSKQHSSAGCQRAHRMASSANATYMYMYMYMEVYGGGHKLGLERALALSRALHHWLPRRPASSWVSVLGCDVRPAHKAPLAER